MKIQIPKNTKNEFVDECFKMDYEEGNETRQWRGLPETTDIPRMGVGPNPREALKRIEEALKKYPDFDFLYTWKGYIHENSFHDLNAAKGVYEEGLKFSLSKISLLDHLAQANYSSGRVNLAIKYWIQSCALQMGAQKTGYAHPFMMLAYAARELGLKKESEALYRQTDRIQNIRLNPIGENEMESRIGDLANPGERESIKKALSLLVDFYKIGKA